MRTAKVCFILCLMMMLSHSAVAAVKIADITRMSGARTNTLIGMGLVVGLKGTGNGGSFQPTARAMANMLGKFCNPSTVAELSNGSNVAIVTVYCTLPANGVRDGDHLDVRVDSIGPATSLQYGTLYMVSHQPMGVRWMPAAGRLARFAQKQATGIEQLTTDR
jgi:flagellar P-ring protein precursor FlgI